MAACFLNEGNITAAAQQQLRAVGVDQIVATRCLETGSHHSRFPIAICLWERSASRQVSDTCGS
jgi:hypothetical protein